jgi:anti-sigma28 factor (negative regulator of flagellin synthesis)
MLAVATGRPVAITSQANDRQVRNVHLNGRRFGPATRGGEDSGVNAKPPQLNRRYEPQRGLLHQTYQFMRISQHESRIRPTVSSQASNSNPARDHSSPAQPSLPDDAVQLSFLAGVLNALQVSAAKTANRAAELTVSIRQQAYSVDSQTLGQKMIQDLLTSN